MQLKATFTNKLSSIFHQKTSGVNHYTTFRNLKLKTEHII